MKVPSILSHQHHLLVNLTKKQKTTALDLSYYIVAVSSLTAVINACMCY